MTVGLGSTSATLDEDPMTEKHKKNKFKFGGTAVVTKQSTTTANKEEFPKRN